MTLKEKLPFDPKLFLAKVGRGRTTAEYQKNEIVFSQSDPADAIFYIQKGKIKLTVVSHNGKEAVIAILGIGDFLGEGCLAAQPLRMATATAMSDCSVVRLEKSATVHVLHEEPAFTELFLAYLLSRNIRIEAEIWWISSSIQVRRGWRGCFSCLPTSTKKASRNPLLPRSIRKRWRR